jgi:hypothetical protein
VADSSPFQCRDVEKVTVDVDENDLESDAKREE